MDSEGLNDQEMDPLVEQNQTAFTHSNATPIVSSEPATVVSQMPSNMTEPDQMDAQPAETVQTIQPNTSQAINEATKQMGEVPLDAHAPMETDGSASQQPQVPVSATSDFIAPQDVRLTSVSPLSIDESSKHSTDSKDIISDPDIARSVAEAAAKAVSPSSISSGSRSRKSSQSSKSPKAHSPGTTSPSGKPRRGKRAPPSRDDVLHDGRNDFYCWVCHREGEVLCCELCPRVFHAKCLHMGKEPEGDWYCPECDKTMVAECKETQSRGMSQLSIDQLALHLRYALQRMKTTGCEPFLDPVDTKKFSDYRDYVFHPMDLKTLEKNIKKRKYGCTEAFLADAKWILHNCIIYNGQQTKLTQIAKTIVKICQHEMSEVEVCPECYLNSCRKRENWFCEPCKEPHLLVWAKLQGFPHWPAKALRIDKGLVDARFFGQHDRAWIPLSGCYLMSKEMPFPVKNKKKGRGPGAKGGLDNAMQEAQHYIDNVSRKLGSFDYAPLRTPLTHMDLYRRSQGIPSNVSTPESVTVKKEAIDVEMNVSPDTSGSKEKVLNLKIPGNDLKDLDLAGSPTTPKKKSKVVTTSGAHPGGQKGIRVGTKKRASTALLEKTIESCKASLLDSLDNSDNDYSSEESESSSEESADEAASSNKSTPSSKGETKAAEEAGAANEVKPPKKAGVESDASDTELVIDIPDEDEAKKILTEKEQRSLGKVKKKVEADKSTKPKSILLNKESSGLKPLERHNISSGSIKRKLTEDSPQPGGGTGKTRRMEGMTKPSDLPKDPKTITKEKKKISAEVSKQIGEKPRKIGDPLGKTRKDGAAVSAAKKSNPDVVSKKKVYAGEPPEKDNLKSTAKLLSQKVMNRKVHTGDKPKSTLEKSKAASNETERKLSSFTIPKHKHQTPSGEGSRVQQQINQRAAAAAAAPVPPQDGAARGFSRHKTFPLQRLEKYNEKVMMGVREVLVEMYEDMMTVFESQAASKEHTSDAKEADVNQQVAQMRVELERLKWMHQQEIAELQHNHDLTIAEVRQSLENEKFHLLEEAKRKAEDDKEQAVKETKQKQWCANCGKEAIFYCCWNTSYCDYPCQQLHWPMHMATCSQSTGAGQANAGSQSAAEESGDVKGKKEVVVSTPTSPTEVAEPAKAPKPEEPPSDEDESDNEMMVIDESLHKDEDPVEETEPGTSNESASSEKPKDEDAEPKKDAELCEEAPPDKESSSSSEVAPATVSLADEEDTKMPDPVKTAASSSNPSARANVTSAAEHTDDDFQAEAVHGGVASGAASLAGKEEPVDRPLAKETAEEPASFHLPEKLSEPSPAKTTPATKAASTHTGSAISAIGERLLKARQKMEATHKESEATKKDTASPPVPETKARMSAARESPSAVENRVSKEEPPKGAEAKISSPVQAFDKRQENDLRQTSTAASSLQSSPPTAFAQETPNDDARSEKEATPNPEREQHVPTSASPLAETASSTPMDASGPEAQAEDAQKQTKVSDAGESTAEEISASADAEPPEKGNSQPPSSVSAPVFADAYLSCLTKTDPTTTPRVEKDDAKG